MPNARSPPQRAEAESSASAAAFARFCFVRVLRGFDSDRCHWQSHWIARTSQGSTLSTLFGLCDGAVLRGSAARLSDMSDSHRPLQLHRSSRFVVVLWPWASESACVRVIAINAAANSTRHCAVQISTSLAAHFPGTRRGHLCQTVWRRCAALSAGFRPATRSLRGKRVASAAQHATVQVMHLHCGSSDSRRVVALSSLVSKGLKQ